MALYIDRRELPEDISSIPDNVLQYVLEKSQERNIRLEVLDDAYMGRNVPPKIKESDISVVMNYPSYIVNTLANMTIGDPVKYNDNEDTKSGLTSGEQLTVKDNKVVRPFKVNTPPADIQPILDAYKEQSISDVDMGIALDIGIYGEAYELIYASDDEEPIPKSDVCSPLCSVMVRDTTRDHKKLFFMTYEQREHIDHSLYYAVYVYTPYECIEYYSDGVTSPLSFHELGRTPHYFQEVPCVEYRNNKRRIGDFEMVLSPINALNELQSDRVTDKKRSVNSTLLFFGWMLDDRQLERLDRNNVIDGLPNTNEGVDAKYLQRALDESNSHILAQDIIDDIHKISSVCNTTDQSFGVASGVALQNKLFPMLLLVKGKIRTLERGFKKRFQIYNQWFSIKGTMPIIDRDEVEVIFTISLPANTSELVDTVVKLQNIVDDETLLAQLPFVKDPAQTIEKVKEQKKEQQQEYFDTFGITQKENTVHAENGIDNGESRDQNDENDTGTNRPNTQIRNTNKNNKDNQEVS